MTPFYDRDGITVYCARWEEVLAAGLIPVRDVALVHADPPYGVNEQTERKKSRSGGGKAWPARDWPRVIDDDKPYDPAPVLAMKRPTVTWGANHYASRLPDSPSWILWDKREETAPDTNADGESAWSNLGGPFRIFRHLWRGLCRASEAGVSPLHPTQKPVALMSWIFRDRAKLKPGNLVLVPYGGSMPELAAARALGLRVIACEVSEDYCRAAIGARLHDVPATGAASVPGDLFSRLARGGA